MISVKGTDKNQLQAGQQSMGKAPVLHTVLCYEILDQNRPVYCSIVVKEKPTLGSPFLGAFPSDATKEVNVHFSIHSSNSYKLYHRIPVPFWRCYVVLPVRICKFLYATDDEWRAVPSDGRVAGTFCSGGGMPVLC
jgi:hypothetical protein